MSIPGRRWTLQLGDSPIVATAVHCGHELRPELQEICALSDSERFREEDPFTDVLASVAPTHWAPQVSRFEVDLNRARHEAVYKIPEDAWGLNLWKRNLPEAFIEDSLNFYDAYYRELKNLLTQTEKKFGAFVVLDIHSYNFRRHGPDKPPEDPGKNPEVNVGTGTMDRNDWAPLVDRFIADLRKFDLNGSSLDVRENIKFRGRQGPSFVHQHFPGKGCALALEFKKIFMDEWTGQLNRPVLEQLRAALRSTLPGILEELKKR
jgi:hypothetical protein